MFVVKNGVRGTHPSTDMDISNIMFIANSYGLLDIITVCSWKAIDLSIKYKICDDSHLFHSSEKCSTKDSVLSLMITELMKSNS